jgi:hypothetical protein
MCTVLVFGTEHLAMLFQTVAPQVHVTGAEAQTSLQVILAFLVSGAINWMKTSSIGAFHWIGDNTPGVTKIVSAISAAAIAAGFAFSSSGSFASSEGLTLVISGLSLTGLTNAVSTFLTQWLTQHLAYVAVWAKPFKPAN